MKNVQRVGSGSGLGRIPPEEDPELDELEELDDEPEEEPLLEDEPELLEELLLEELELEEDGKI